MGQHPLTVIEFPNTEVTESLQSSNNKKRKRITQKAHPATHLGLLRHEAHVDFLADPDVLCTVQLHVVEQVIWAI